MQDQPVNVVNSDAYQSPTSVHNVPGAPQRVSTFHYDEKAVALG